MRRAIAGLIAGLVLGTATTAGAAGVYWNRGGSAYRCEGISSGVTCKSGRFEVGITPGFVYVQERGTKLTYGCKKWESFADCFSD